MPRPRVRAAAPQARQQWLPQCSFPHEQRALVVVTGDGEKSSACDESRGCGRGEPLAPTPRSFSAHGSRLLLVLPGDLGPRRAGRPVPRSVALG
jgi:hypothetical protein